MLFLAAALAFLPNDVAAPERAADAIAILVTVTPQNAVPGVDAVIPTNAHLFAFVGTGDQALDVTFDRFTPDGSTRLDATRVAGLSTAFDVDLGALTPGEALVLQANCNSCFDQFTFTVGENDDVTAPVVEAGVGVARFHASPFRNGSGIFSSVVGYSVSGCLSRATDENGAALRVTLDDDTHLTGLFPLAGDDGCGTRVDFTVNGGGARDLCFAASAVDVAGNESSLGDDTCVTLDPGEDGGGCSAASSSSSSLLGALALLLLVRLRSRS